MKALVIIAASALTLSAARADERLEGRIELMKLTYACGSKAEYKRARDAALRAEQMATVGTPDKIVVTLDAKLRAGSAVADMDKSQCANKLEQLRFELKASGAY